jgi:hypothetical protein
MTVTSVPPAFVKDSVVVSAAEVKNSSSSTGVFVKLEDALGTKATSKGKGPKPGSTAV